MGYNTPLPYIVNSLIMIHEMHLSKDQIIILDKVKVY